VRGEVDDWRCYLQGPSEECEEKERTFTVIVGGMGWFCYLSLVVVRGEKKKDAHTRKSKIVNGTGK
jgi:hypothetical protein